MSERTKAVKALDAAYSIYVRKSHADEYGMVACWTCGKKTYWEKEGMQAGHFQTRNKYSTRWHYEEIGGKVVTLNCKPQCGGCNMVMGGRNYEFGNRLNQVYGEGTAERIIAESNALRKFTTPELRELTQFFKKLTHDCDLHT